MKKRYRQANNYDNLIQQANSILESREQRKTPLEPPVLPSHKSKLARLLDFDLEMKSFLNPLLSFKNNNVGIFKVPLASLSLDTTSTNITQIITPAATRTDLLLLGNIDPEVNQPIPNNSQHSQNFPDDLFSFVDSADFNIFSPIEEDWFKQFDIK